jgi:hypothetical protein
VPGETFQPLIDLYSMKKGEEQETYELIVRVFHKYVAPVYSENGVARFLGMLSPDRLFKSWV